MSKTILSNEKSDGLEIPKRFLRGKDVAKFLGVSYSCICKWRVKGEIPQPIIVSGSVTVWDAKELEEFILKKPRLKSATE